MGLVLLFVEKETEVVELEVAGEAFFAEHSCDHLLLLGLQQANRIQQTILVLNIIGIGD